MGDHNNIDEMQEERAAALARLKKRMEERERSKPEESQAPESDDANDENEPSEVVLEPDKCEEASSDGSLSLLPETNTSTVTNGDSVSSSPLSPPKSKSDPSPYEMVLRIYNSSPIAQDREDDEQPGTADEPNQKLLIESEELGRGSVEFEHVSGEFITEPKEIADTDEHLVDKNAVNEKKHDITEKFDSGAQDETGVDALNPDFGLASEGRARGHSGAGLSHETSIVHRKPKRYHFESKEDDDIPVLDRYPFFDDKNESGKEISGKKKLEGAWKDSLRKRNPHLESSTIGEHLKKSHSLHITQEGKLRKRVADYAVTNYFLLDRIPVNRYARYKDPTIAEQPMYSVGCIFFFVTLKHREQFMSLTTAGRGMSVEQFEKEFTEAVKGTISLEKAQVVELKHDASQVKHYEFVIRTPEQEVSLIAESEDGRREWVDKIRETIVFDEEGERLFEAEQSRLKALEEERIRKETEEAEKQDREREQKKQRLQLEEERRKDEARKRVEERMNEETRRKEQQRAAEERRLREIEEQKQEEERLQAIQKERDTQEKEAQERQKMLEEEHRKKMEEEQKAEALLEQQREELRRQESEEKKLAFYKVHEERLKKLEEDRLERNRKTLEQEKAEEKELQQFIDDFRDRPCEFLKHSYNFKTKASYRNVFIGLDKKGNIESISWTKQKKNGTMKTIPLGRVHSIVAGRRTSTLRKRADKRGFPSTHNNCFSVVYRQRTLDLQCPLEEGDGRKLRDGWVKGLNLALRKFRQVNAPAVLNDKYRPILSSSEDDDDFAVI